MNGKDSKVPIYIAIIIALLLVGAGGYFLLGGPSVLPIKKPEVTPGETPTVTEAPATPPSTGSTPAVTTTAPVRAETIKCELCHTNANTLAPHVNGGKLCINCHGSQVHNIHIGAGTVDLKCDTCHGLPPNIRVPTVEKGEGPGHYSVCEQCHAAPPNSLQPSNGDLIVIHLSRTKYCTNCHGTDISEIHAASISNATKK